MWMSGCLSAALPTAACYEKVCDLNDKLNENISMERWKKYWVLKTKSFWRTKQISKVVPDGPKQWPVWLALKRNCDWPVLRLPLQQLERISCDELRRMTTIETSNIRSILWYTSDFEIQWMKRSAAYFCLTWPVRNARNSHVDNCWADAI